MRVLIVVTHLLGTGHVRRAVTLARGFSNAGHDVCVVSGGTPVAGLDTKDVRLIQLPPLKSDGTNFTDLLTDNGHAADAAYLDRRQADLLATLDMQPDVLITELFPFGRRVLTQEFTALLVRAQTLDTVPLILASIRDILAPPSKPAKAEKTQELIARFYDGVLVHSDPKVIPLSVSWPVDAALEDKLHYTGFVAPPAPRPHPEEAGTGDVLVTAGGGAVGDPLFRAACEAARLAPDLRWRLLVGGAEPKARIAQLSGTAPDNVIVEPARPDFPNMLQHAACSVSMAGYNTALDVLQTGVPALFVPFDEAGEVEQTLRADTLAHLPGIEVLRSADISPAHLANAVRRLCAQPRRPTQSIEMDGARRSVEIVTQLSAGRL